MLIKILKYIQARDNLTNQQFADKLGIHKYSWYRIKSYRKPFGRKFLSCVRQAYPELKDAIDSYLAGDSFTFLGTKDIPPYYPVKPSVSFLGGLIDKVRDYIKRLY